MYCSPRFPESNTVRETRGGENPKPSFLLLFVPSSPPPLVVVVALSLLSDCSGMLIWDHLPSPTKVSPTTEGGQSVKWYPCCPWSEKEEEEIPSALIFIRHLDSPPNGRRRRERLIVPSPKNLSKIDGKRWPFLSPIFGATKHTHHRFPLKKENRQIERKEEEGRGGLMGPPRHQGERGNPFEIYRGRIP